MTNGEKYLKDGVNRQFLTEFSMWYYSITREIKNVDTVLAEFLAEKVQPTLTEDERVILRNIDNGFTKIRREHGELYSYNKFTGNEYDVPFNHLFQFVKERRRI